MKEFEEITSPLTIEERNAVPILINRFKGLPGKKNLVSARKIIEGLKANRGITLTGARLRKVINYIRINHKLVGLVANSKGYYLTTNPDELNSWIISLREREAAIKAVREAAEEDLRELRKRQQLKMF